MCQPHDLYGFKRRTPGAMASYMIYPAEALVHKVSGDVAPHHAAFAEPLSCSLHAVERAQITFEDTVVVAGCGPIGLGMVAGARAKNPMSVIALDMAPDKLELAKACGADITINIAEQDAEAIVKNLTDGYGADVYLEGTGHPSAVPQGLNLLRKLGRYVEYGVFGSDVSVDWSIISDDKELDVLGAHLGPVLLAGRDQDDRVGGAAHGSDLHPSTPADRLPEGAGSGGQRQGIGQGLPDSRMSEGQQQMSDFSSSSRGLRFSRRQMLTAMGVAGAAAASVPVLSSCGVGGRASAPNGADAVTGGFDWRKAAGSTINILQTPHPYQLSYQPLLAEFTELTGINVNVDLVPEADYFTKLNTELAGGSGKHDAFMLGAYFIWQYGPPGWIEDLNPWLQNGVRHQRRVRLRGHLRRAAHVDALGLHHRQPAGHRRSVGHPVGFREQRGGLQQAHLRREGHHEAARTTSTTSSSSPST